MRWKSHRGHDPRQIDLAAALALVIIIIAAYRYFDHRAADVRSAPTFIVPSQSVRW